jgi:hypothetical protein
MSDKIRDKALELISNLTVQLLTPEPTTYEADAKLKALVGDEMYLRAELSALLEAEKQEPEENLCVKN